MDWIIRLQKAIEYIEANLADDQGELQLDLIAREAYSSEFNFQKVFSIITGITVGEYIRNRRLMLAGEELMYFSHSMDGKSTKPNGLVLLISLPISNSHTLFYYSQPHI